MCLSLKGKRGWDLAELNYFTEHMSACFSIKAHDSFFIMTAEMKKYISSRLASFFFCYPGKNSPGVHSLHIWGLELNPLMMHFAGWKIIKTPSWPFAAAYFARWRLQAMTHCRVQRSRCSNRSGCSINQDTHNAEHAWIPERQKWDVDAKVWSCESVWACQANSLLSLLHRA